MILGLKGLKGSGKDTVAAYLIKQHGFERRAFADPLKRSVAALLDIPYHEIDRWKNDRGIWVELTDGGSERLHAPLTFREFLQRYGTEAHRDIFGENFWLDYTLPRDGYWHGKKIAITDCRFENEARRVNLVGGFVVQIKRPGLDFKDQHRSEEEFPLRLVDYELINDGTFEKLYEMVEVMLTDLGGVAYQVEQAVDR
jgi:hypothetical protein